MDGAAQTWSRTTFVMLTDISLIIWEGVFKYVLGRGTQKPLQDFGNHLHHHLPWAKQLVARRLLLLLYQAPGIFLSPINDFWMMKTRRARLW